MLLKKIIALTILFSTNSFNLSGSNFSFAYATSGSYETSKETYYENITATGRNSLLGQLHDLITTTHKTYTSYDDCKNVDYVYQTDPGTSSSYVTDIYTQKDISKTWGSGAQGTWNREHVWCQSLSGGLWGESGGGGDIHHIRPDECSLNSTRGNKKYANVRQLYPSSYNSAYARNKSGSNTDLGGYYADNYFEPIDSAKGDIARIVMYVYTHYNTYSNVHGTTNGSGSTSYFGNIPITNIARGSTSGSDAAWALLLSWSELDPVSTKEITRNEAAASMTGCRNPFIDHPEYANAIWGDVELPDPTGSLSISKSSMTLTVGESGSTIFATSSDESAITWTLSDDGIVSLSSTSSASGANITVTPVESGITDLVAHATIDGESYTKTCQITVKTASTGGGTGTDEGLPEGTYSIVATDLGTKSSGYAACDGNHTCESGIKITSSNACNQDDKIQLKKSSGYIFNSTAENIDKIVVNSSSSFTVYGGVSSHPTTATITGESGEYDLSGYKYFTIKAGSSTVTISSIQVYISGNSSSASDLAEAYAKQFIEANVCGLDDNTSAISSIWLVQKEKFEALDESVKNILIYGDANQYGTTNLAKCLAKYDRVLYLHGSDTSLFPDFMSRKSAGTFSYSNVSNIMNYNNSFIIIVIIGSISLASISSMLILLKKKKRK